MSIRVGFIGTGGIANAHMRCLQEVPDVELVAFCDIVEERAKTAAEEHNGKAFTDHKPMFDEVEMDALYICLPPHAHTDQELMAVERGIPFLVEKPITRTWEKAKEIEAAVDGAGLITSVGYHWRYYDVTERARQELDGRTIGMVLGWWMGGLPGVAWWRVLEQSGGQILEQTTHICDLARCYAGDVKRVYARLALRALQDAPNLDVPDVGTVALEFASGAVGTISNSCMAPRGYLVGLDVLCRDFLIQHRAGKLMIRSADGVEELEDPTNPKIKQSRIFIEAVRSGDASKIESPYSDGVKSLAISLAALKSQQTGEPVELADL
jgi:predicted dehydrogenase